MSQEVDDAVCEQVKNLLAGVSVESAAKILRRCVDELDIGVLTPSFSAMRTELICDPIVWVEADLETVSIEQWEDVGGYKILNERSIELGQEVRTDIESWWTKK